MFHHHAHAVSLLFQHNLTGAAIFAVFDGTGYGTDGTIWGGELLIADASDFSRAGHLGLFHLPGGEAAIRERCASCGFAFGQRGTAQEFLPLMGNMHG